MAKTLFTEDELKQILDKDLLDLMGVANMPDDKKAELYAKMAATIQDRVLLRVDDALDEEGKKQFGEIIDTGDQAKTNEFLVGKGLNVPQLLVQEAMLYKLEMMSLLKINQNQKEEVEDTGKGE
jgi:hypothetical protein